VKKRSDIIRANIGSLIYEQQIYQNADNDHMMDKIQAKIDKLRSQLFSVEEEEKKIKIEEEKFMDEFQEASKTS
jgi:hypothetical protein